MSKIDEIHGVLDRYESGELDADGAHEQIEAWLARYD